MRHDRRAFLRGNISADSTHISSLVVHSRRDKLESVIAAISALEDAEVPQFSDQGKLVVLLETASEGRIMQNISTIEGIPGVISAALVYHEIDDNTGESA